MNLTLVAGDDDCNYNCCINKKMHKNNQKATKSVKILVARHSNVREQFISIYSMYLIAKCRPERNSTKRTIKNVSEKCFLSKSNSFENISIYANAKLNITLICYCLKIILSITKEKKSDNFSLDIDCRNQYFCSLPM